MEIVQRIKEICDKRNINGVELGKILGLKQSPLTDWKNGKAKPTLEQISGICEYFSISSDYLLTGQEPPPKELTTDEAEWLELYRNLEPSAKIEYRSELKGYLRRAKEENFKIPENDIPVEERLITNQGEIQIECDDKIVYDLATEYKLSSLEEETIKTFVNFPSAVRKDINKYVMSLLETAYREYREKYIKQNASSFAARHGDTENIGELAALYDKATKNKE